jgi:hypothetical protein
MQPIDLKRELRIQALGLRMLSAYARYEATGCFSDRGEADGLRIEMEREISSRSQTQVESMALARGLPA